LRILQRQGGERDEAIGMALGRGGDLVVLQDSAGGAERRLLVIEEGMHGGADGLHVDAMLVHVGKTQIEVPAFLRHRPLHHFARDLHDRRAVGLRNQPRRHTRRFLAEPLDRLPRQHVGVDVDGTAAFHRGDHISTPLPSAPILLAIRARLASPRPCLGLHMAQLKGQDMPAP
jgi:hypothetical protein